jgi:DNA-binding protein YbaB
MTAVERNADGRVDAAIGCVDTGTSVIEVTVAGNPLAVDVSVEERLSEDDDEGLRDTLDNIAVRRSTFAVADLDDEATDGLIRLLARAREVRRLALAVEDESATRSFP